MTKRFFFLLVLCLFLITVPAYAENGSSGKEEIKVEIKNELEEDEDRFEIKGNEFEIRGRITAVTNNTITVLGQVVTIDSSQVKEFKQRGDLIVGKFVKVKGIILGNNKFAREIKISDDQDEAKIEIKIDPTPASAAPQAEIKIKGLLDQIRDLIEQLLTFLRNLGR